MVLVLLFSVFPFHNSQKDCEGLKDLSTYLHVVAVMLVNGKDVCLAAVLQVVVLSCSNAELLEFYMQ